MSYLDTPRLHFFGQFTANPSTVNNNPANYDFANPLISSWNDDGNHTFALQSALVTSVVLPKPGGPPDSIVGATVASTGRAVLVDLDTEQQLASMIYGLNVQIANVAGTASITAAMTPVNFFDINFGRANIPNGPQTDGVAGAAYQSVLTNVQFTGDWTGSGWVQAILPILQANGNMLSIRFIVDGMHDQPSGPLFTTGRVTGTIGPYLSGEPQTFVNGRLLRPTTAGASQNYNYIPAKTDTGRKKLVMDFGNAFTTNWPQWPQGFPVAAEATLNVIIDAAGGAIDLGAIDTSETAYYNNAMVQEFDVADYLEALSTSPTAVVGATGTQYLAENAKGAFAMFEPFVFRLDPGGTGEVTLTANVFEQPAKNVKIGLKMNPQLLANQASSGPAVGTPDGIVTFPDTVTTGDDGTVSFTLTASEKGPGNPRGYIDGQLYPIEMQWKEDTNPDPNTFLSVHAYDYYQQPTNPTWKDVQWILAIYARLYPAMMAVINLANYDDVVAAASAIKARVQLDIDNPGLMPITRELSTAKMQTIVTWIDNGTP